MIKHQGHRVTFIPYIYIHLIRDLKTQSGHPPTRVFMPTFLLASSSSSLRTHPASVRSGLVRGDSCCPSGLWLRVMLLSVPVPPPEPLPLTTTWWGLSAGDSSDPGLSRGGREVTEWDTGEDSGQWWGWMEPMWILHVIKSNLHEIHCHLAQ